jgi:hypothetical protein
MNDCLLAFYAAFLSPASSRRYHSFRRVRLRSIPPMDSTKNASFRTSW